MCFQKLIGKAKNEGLTPPLPSQSETMGPGLRSFASRPARALATHVLSELFVHHEQAARRASSREIAPSTHLHPPEQWRAEVIVEVVGDGASGTCALGSVRFGVRPSF